MPSRLCKEVTKIYKNLIYFKISLGTSMTDLLNKEIHKPKLLDSVLKARKCIFYEPTDSERDIGKITMILRNMPEFKKFIKFNNIDHDSIRLAANYMEYIKIPKDTYIFKQGELSKNFYGVINGKISIRIEERRAINLSKSNSNIIDF
jgi:hypothetical protein